MSKPVLFTLYAIAMILLGVAAAAAILAQDIGNSAGFIAAVILLGIDVYGKLRDKNS